jgi:hypothetical protein
MKEEKEEKTDLSRIFIEISRLIDSFVKINALN